MTPTAVAIIALFGLSGGFFAFRTVRSRRAPDRIFDASHLVMSAVMITMAIGWSTRIPAVLQLTVFTGFALWYVYLAMFRPHAVRVLVDGTSPAGSGSDHHSGRARLVYHAAMMLAMAWMAVIMAPLPSADASDMGEMGMHMSGHSDSIQGASAMSLPAWANPVSIIIGIGFAGATLWYVVRFVLFAGTRRLDNAAAVRRLTDLASAVLMAAGMALALLVDMT